MRFITGVLALAVLGAGSASAGVGGAAGPTWPATLSVGNPVSAYIDIINASDGLNASENVDILQITFTPSCAAQTVGTCTTPDLGVFTLAPIAIGDPNSSCKNIVFTFLGPTPAGVFTLSPSAPVHLGPADGSGGVNNPKQCRVVINATVSKMPVDSTPPNPPVTTIQFARAVLRGATSQSVGAAVGQATVAINSMADLLISKTDGVSSVNTGSSTTYTVTVTNNGPSPANGAIVTDPAVAGLSKTAAACIGATGGAACPGSTTVAELEGAGVVIPTLPKNGTVTFTVTADVTAASGTVKNSASVAPPAGTTNPGTSCTTLPDPNSRDFAANVCTAGDLDNVALVNDLLIGKTNGVLSVNSGTSTTYTVTVTNNGPSPADGAVVTDPVATGLSKTAAACIGTTGGAACPASTTTALLEGAGVVIPTFPSAATVTFTVTADVTAVSGTVKNTASVTPVAGATNPGTSCTTLPDPNSRSFAANVCTAGDLDDVGLVADLVISKSTSAVDYLVGDVITYTVVVANNGPSPLVNVPVSDTRPSQITTWSWACGATTGGASGCTAAGNVTPFTDQIDLPANSSLAYIVTATVSGSATGDIVNKATVTPPAGATNPGTSCVTSGGINRSFNDPTTGACSSTVTLSPGLGVGGGHFDFDIYYFDSGKYKNKKHIHQWDNKWNVTGVNTTLPSDTNFRNVNFMLAGTQFKVLVANQFLNPAAFMAVGTGTTQESVKTYGGLAGPSTDAATVLSGLTTHTASGTSYNPDGSTVRLIINLPKTAFNSIDWWGAGGDGQPRAGVIPNQTGCVNGVNDNGSTDDVGKLGERFNGALTVTVIKADTPAEAIELNVPGDPRYGWRVKVTAAPNPFAAWVLGEYTIFWHHPNGECYNEVTWVPNPPLEDESGTPAARPAGTADPNGPIPPNPTIAP